MVQSLEGQAHASPSCLPSHLSHLISMSATLSRKPLPCDVTRFKPQIDHFKSVSLECIKNLQYRNEHGANTPRHRPGGIVARSFEGRCSTQSCSQGPTTDLLTGWKLYPWRTASAPATSTYLPHEACLLRDVRAGERRRGSSSSVVSPGDIALRRVEPNQRDWSWNAGYDAVSRDERDVFSKVHLEDITSRGMRAAGRERCLPDAAEEHQRVLLLCSSCKACIPDSQIRTTARNVGLHHLESTTVELKAIRIRGFMAAEWHCCPDVDVESR